MFMFIFIFLCCFLSLKTQALVSGKKNIPRYYIYHKVRNGSFVKNLGHRVYLGIFFLPETSACDETLNFKSQKKTKTTNNKKYSIMPDINITNHGIAKLLSNLDPSKAAGSDELKPKK